MRKSTDITEAVGTKTPSSSFTKATSQFNRGNILAGVFAIVLLTACDDDEKVVFVPTEPTQPAPEIVNYNQYTDDHHTAHEVSIDYDALQVEQTEVLTGFPLEVSVTAIGLDLSGTGETGTDDYAAFYAQLIPANATSFSVLNPQYKIGTFHFEDNDHFNADSGWEPVITQLFRLDLDDTIPNGDYRLVVISAHAKASAQQDEQFNDNGNLVAANLGLNSLSDLPLVTLAANTENTFDVELQATHSQTNVMVLNSADTTEPAPVIPVLIEHYMWGKVEQTPEARVVLEAEISGQWEPLDLVVETSDNVLSDKNHEVLNIAPFDISTTANAGSDTNTGTNTNNAQTRETAQRKNQGLAGRFSAAQQQSLLTQANDSNEDLLSIPLRLRLTNTSNSEFNDTNQTNNQVALAPVLVLPLDLPAPSTATFSASSGNGAQVPFLAAMDSPFAEGDHRIFNSDFSKEYSIDTDIIDLDLASISETTDVNYTIGPVSKPSVIFNANSTVNFEVLGTGNVEAVNATAAFQAGLLPTNGWNVQIGGQIPTFDDNGLQLEDGKLVLEDFTLFSSEKSVDIAFSKSFDWKVSRDLTLAQKAIPVGVIPVTLSAGTNGEISSDLTLSGSDSDLSLNGKPVNTDVGSWLTVGINLNQNLVSIDSLIDLDVNLILDAGFTASVTLLQADINIDTVGYTYSDTSSDWVATGSLSTQVNLIEAELDITVQVGAEVDIDAGFLGSSNGTYYVVNEDNVQVASTDGYLLSPVEESHTF